MNIALRFLACLVFVLLPIAAPAQVGTSKDDHDEIVLGGPWRFHSIPCVDGVVDSVGPRLMQDGQTKFTQADYAATGVSVSFRVPAAFKFMPNMGISQPAVVHYQGDFDNALMGAEKHGDRVQICLMSYPTPTYDARAAQYRCDPDRDPRGYTFRVYDYLRHKAYFGPSSQHYCGGA